MVVVWVRMCAKEVWLACWFSIVQVEMRGWVCCGCGWWVWRTSEREDLFVVHGTCVLKMIVVHGMVPPGIVSVSL